MPCNEDRNRGEETTNPFLENNLKLKTKQIENLQAENKKLMRLLCAACRALKRLGHDFDENHELSKWWSEHQKEDAIGERLGLLKDKKTKKAIAIVDGIIASLNKDQLKLLIEEGFIERS